MFAHDPTNIDEQVTDLSYWVSRACAKRSNGEWHYTYRGVSLVVHPHRAAQATYEGRFVLVGDDDGRYKGRGWLDRLVGDIENAIDLLLDGRGEELPENLGDALRAEIERRAQGNKPSGLDREWWQWLTNDELPILLGCWLHQAGIMSLKYTITRQPKLGFYPTNNEFDLGVQACQTHTLWVTLKRLAQARQHHALAEHAHTEEG